MNLETSPLMKLIKEKIGKSILDDTIHVIKS